MDDDSIVRNLEPEFDEEAKMQQLYKKQNKLRINILLYDLKKIQDGSIEVKQAIDALHRLEQEIEVGRSMTRTDFFADDRVKQAEEVLKRKSAGDVDADAPTLTLKL